MNVEHQKRATMKVVGISTRTSNAEEMAGAGKIGKLWGRFFRDAVLEDIPHQKEPGTVLALYTDYESDENGPYTILLGAEVTRVEQLPPGLVWKEIPAADYAVVTSSRGSLPAIVIDVWKKIWSASPKDLGGRRRYSGDFEVYGPTAKNPHDAEVTVFLSITPA